jgi:hypothetical protein
MRLFIISALFLTAAGLAGCPYAPNDVGCKVDTDCASGQRCADNHTCGARSGTGGEGEGEGGNGSCTVDADCGSGERCNDAGQCVAAGTGGNTGGTTASLRVCETFSSSHTSLVQNVLASYGQDMTLVRNDVNGTASNTSTVCGNITGDSHGMLKVNVSLDGGGDTRYLAINVAGDHCGLNANFVRLTVNGTTRTVQPILWGFNPNSLPPSGAIGTSSGCDGWVDLP